jgi:phosphatidylglycerophosphatase A
MSKELGAKGKLAYVLATWFGCGMVPGAPGTVGSIGAIPLYLAIRRFGVPAIAVAAVVVTFVGVWAADEVAKHTEKKDPQIVVIDEVAGVLITMLTAPTTGWRAAVAGLVLFRICDQFKPWPARLAERRMPGGWGIVFDDVFAGVWAAAGVAALRAAELL